MTGWRLGFAHGPARLIEEMTKLQQFSFVCAPSIVQHAGVAALDVDLSAQVAAYRRKRDAVVAALPDRFELAHPGRRLLRLPAAPRGGPATEFVAEAIRHNLLIIPGNVFSRRDTHFRISYAVDDATLRRASNWPMTHGHAIARSIRSVICASSCLNAEWIDAMTMSSCARQSSARSSVPSARMSHSMPARTVDALRDDR